MIDIKTILCPVDFSEFSRHALTQAVQLARWFDSQLFVLHVYPVPGTPPSVLYGGFPGPLPPFPAVTVSPESTRQAILADVAKFVETVDTSGISVHASVRAGSPVAGILEEAGEHRSDLIVLGTHGHSGFERWIIGSATEKVLRKAACPVMTVPRASEPSLEPTRLFKRILCAVDFSEASLKGLEYAFTLAKESDAELILLHVLDPMPDPPDWRAPNDPSTLEHLRLIQAGALERLTDLVPEGSRSWCRTAQILATGKPYQEILQAARRLDVHLLIMGIHGRNPIDLMFFGSTANHVVRGSTCPVLTVRG
jgi:nucleotide-binding universal stress UspA family protein